MCREVNDFVRPLRQSNPVRDMSVKDLAQRFEGTGVYQLDEEIISNNAEVVIIHIDIAESCDRGGTVVEFEDSTLVSKREQYMTDLYVDRRTGKILGFSHGGELDMELACRPHIVQLELQVLVDHAEFIQDHPDYQQYQFVIAGPENPATGCPCPLDSLVSARAVSVLRETMDICNEPNG